MIDIVCGSYVVNAQADFIKQCCYNTNIHTVYVAPNFHGLKLS